jgi:hypothetical protein
MSKHYCEENGRPVDHSRINHIGHISSMIAFFFSAMNFPTSIAFTMHSPNRIRPRSSGCSVKMAEMQSSPFSCWPRFADTRFTAQFEMTTSTALSGIPARRPSISRDGIPLKTTDSGDRERKLQWKDAHPSC